MRPFASGAMDVSPLGGSVSRLDPESLFVIRFAAMETSTGFRISRDLFDVGEPS